MRRSMRRWQLPWRLGEVFPHRDMTVPRGIEGARMKQTYRIAAERAGIHWNGRRYDRQNPTAADLPNQALNHAATATIPQLGFIREASGMSFVLDVADLVRDAVTVPCAFRAAAIERKRPGDSIERIARRLTGERLRRDGVISTLMRSRTPCGSASQDGPVGRDRVSTVVPPDLKFTLAMSKSDIACERENVMPNVSLTPELEGFAEACVTSGRFGNVSEVMRAALRLLQAQEEKRAAFVRMLEKVDRAADEQGCHEVDDVIAEVDAELAARDKASGAARRVGA
jgi:putative addiction module CopG family antidote